MLTRTPRSKAAPSSPRTVLIMTLGLFACTSSEKSEAQMGTSGTSPDAEAPEFISEDLDSAPDPNRKLSFPAPESIDLDTLSLSFGGSAGASGAGNSDLPNGGPPCPSEQWECADNVGCDFYSELRYDKSSIVEDCECNETRPRSHEECASSEQFACMILKLNDLELRYHCTCASRIPNQVTHSESFDYCERHLFSQPYCAFQIKAWSQHEILCDSVVVRFP